MRQHPASDRRSLCAHMTIASVLAFLGLAGAARLADSIVAALSEHANPLDLVTWAHAGSLTLGAGVCLVAGSVAGRGPGPLPLVGTIACTLGVGPFVPGWIVRVVALGPLAEMVPMLFLFSLLHIPVLLTAVWLGAIRRRRPVHLAGLAGERSSREPRRQGMLRSTDARRCGVRSPRLGRS